MTSCIKGSEPIAANTNDVSKKEGKHWLEYAIFVFVVLTAVASGFAAWYTRQQWRTAVDTEHRQLRAYIMIEHTKGQTLSFHAGEKLRWDVQYVNYGTTISIDEATDAHVWIGESAISRMEEYFLKPALPQPERMAHFTTPPNSNSAPGDPNFRFVTLFSDAVPTKDDITFAATHDGGAVLAGRVWYKDIFGMQHWTDFCRYTLAAGAISSCPSYNEIH